jgi:hypothetical protein
MKLRHSRIALLGATVACAAAAGLSAAPAKADLGGLLGGVVSTVTNVVAPSCGVVSHPFASVDGDTGSYFPVANSGFESGATGWTLSGGARIVLGSEPWNVSGPGSYSLALPSGSSALGPQTCIGLLDPTIRAFANDHSGTDRGLNARIEFRSLAGILLGAIDQNTLAPSAHQSWQPTAPTPSLLGGLPLLTAYFQVRLTPQGWGSNWRVDDVFVDPWVNGLA